MAQNQKCQNFDTFGFEPKPSEEQIYHMRYTRPPPSHPAIFTRSRARLHIVRAGIVWHGIVGSFKDKICENICVNMTWFCWKHSVLVWFLQLRCDHHIILYFLKMLEYVSCKCESQKLARLFTTCGSDKYGMKLKRVKIYIKKRQNKKQKNSALM